MILPSVGFMIRVIKSTIVDFPEPDLPTSAIDFLKGNFKFMFFNASSLAPSYLKLTLLNCINSLNDSAIFKPSKKYYFPEFYIPLKPF